MPEKKLPPGIQRAVAKESKGVLPVAGARQARQAIQGYIGMDPSYSVMDPEAQSLASAYRGGETASVLGDLAASLTPFAAASAAAKANQLPGIAELIAYHGSPHKFKKFDASKIGTGEGAQAYGHGLYFAENPAVAKDYRKELATEVTIDGKPYFTGGRKVSSTGDRTIDDFLTWHVGDVPKAIEAARRMGFDEYIPKLEALKDRVKRVQGGALYTVDIPDEKIAQMLDWDKPLSQQPKAVRNLFPTIDEAKAIDAEMTRLSEAALAANDINSPAQMAWDAMHKSPRYRMARIVIDEANPKLRGKFASGQEIYQAISSGDNIAASEQLKSMGIPGIQYLDQASRDAKQGTRNFVLFPGEEQNIKMLDINGEPQMAKGGKVRISNNPNTMRLELLRKKHA